MKSIRLLPFLFIPVFCCAQQKTAGEWPRPAYQKFPAEYNYLPLADIAYGTAGWFDDYVHAVMVDHNNRIWLAGRYGLAYSDDNGLKWEQSFNSYSVCDIFETRAHTLLASSDNSYTMRSEDGGKKWSHKNVFGKNGPTGRSSHGERYTDVFYVQLNSKRILRTCQYSDKLLLSDDEGRTWKIAKGPDHPDAVFNIGDTLAVMFTHDEMYLSEEGGETWKKQHAGLPVPRDPVYEVIKTGAVLEDGTIIALVAPMEEQMYEYHAWFFDLQKMRWTQDTSGRIYSWTQSTLYAAGNNRLLLWDHDADSYSLSYDKGTTWSVITGNEHMNYIQDLHAMQDKIYFISNATLSCIRFPQLCVNRFDELPLKNNYIALSDSVKGKVAISPVRRETESEEFCIYQRCAIQGAGYTPFLLHIPKDTLITVISISRSVGADIVTEQTFDIYRWFRPGDYELLIYNDSAWSGAFFLRCRFQNENSTDVAGTVCYFY